MPDPITLYTLSRDHVDADGGQMLIIQGEFSLDIGKALNVHVGSAGNATDPLCVSGVAGKGTTIYPATTTKLRCFFPMLESGGPYNVYVRRTDMSRAGLMSGVITVLPKMYYSSVFDLRTILPPFYKTGPRNIDLLEAV